MKNIKLNDLLKSSVDKQEFYQCLASLEYATTDFKQSFREVLMSLSDEEVQEIADRIDVVIGKLENELPNLSARLK